MGGYINGNGEFVERTGRFAFGRNRPEIFATDPGFAANVATNQPRLLIYGLSASEIVQEFWRVAQERSTWQEFGEGFASYPVDVGWALYGVTAATGAIGGLHKARVQETNAKAWDLLTDGFGAIGSASTQSDGQHGIRLAVMINVLCNYLIQNRAAGVAGRFLGGFTTTAVTRIVLSRIPVVGTTIARNPFFSAAFFLVASYGSVVRLGERFHQERGGVDHLTLPEMLATALTGNTDNRNLNSSLRALEYGLEGNLRQMIWLFEAAARGYTVRSAINDARLLIAHGNEILERMRVLRGSEAFYDQVIEAHNLAVRMKALGFENEFVAQYVLLGDPTLLGVSRSLGATFMAIFDSMLAMPPTPWFDVVRAELAQLGRMNDRGN